MEQKRALEDAIAVRLLVVIICGRSCEVNAGYGQRRLLLRGHFRHLTRAKPGCCTRPSYFWHHSISAPPRLFTASDWLLHACHALYSASHSISPSSCNSGPRSRTSRSASCAKAPASRAIQGLARGRYGQLSERPSLRWP